MSSSLDVVTPDQLTRVTGGGLGSQIGALIGGKGAQWGGIADTIFGMIQSAKGGGASSSSSSGTTSSSSGDSGGGGGFNLGSIFKMFSGGGGGNPLSSFLGGGKTGSESAGTGE